MWTAISNAQANSDAGLLQDGGSRGDGGSRAGVAEYEQGPLNGVEGAKYLYREVLASLTTPTPVVG